MKIRDTGGVSPLTGVGPVQPASGSRPAQEVSRGDGPVDVTSIMGIPEAELTPKVRQAIAELMAEVQHLREEIDRLKKRAEYLEQLADQDSLAPILNRRAFVRELSRNSAFAERYDAEVSVLYFDINGMKEVNDAMGHSAGDVALKHVADSLLNNVRASDVVGRLGGDEFGVILAQSGTGAARQKAAELAEAIAGTDVTYNGQSFRIGVAFGVYTLSAGDRVDEALDAADRNMYEHKRATGSQEEDIPLPEPAGPSRQS
jgi:diguanylate cyclase (GGDEF)-like protein